MLQRVFMILLLAFLVRGEVFAGNNPAPFGLELGVATYAQVKSDLGSQTRLNDMGVNAYSGGKMLKGDGEGLDFEGLSAITLIFDQGDRLAGVLMTLPKGEMGNGNFKKVLAMLKGKYKLVSERVPYVGNSYAKLKQGNSIVELDAPHLSFTMQLRYLTQDLLAAFNAQSNQERANKDKAQFNRL